MFLAHLCITLGPMAYRHFNLKKIDRAKLVVWTQNSSVSDIVWYCYCFFTSRPLTYNWVNSVVVKNAD